MPSTPARPSGSASSTASSWPTNSVTRRWSWRKNHRRQRRHCRHRQAAFHAQLPLDVPEAYALAQQTIVENALTADAQEGIVEFLQKRPAKWTS